MTNEYRAPDVPLILSFDTSNQTCSVTLYKDHILYSQSDSMIRGHSEALLPMILDGLSEAGTGFEAIDLIAVGVGPGAFTGVRIGVAAARGLSLVLKKPSVGITTMDAIAAGVSSEMLRGRSLIVALDTKRRDFYLSVFGEDRSAIDGTQIATPDDLIGLVRRETRYAIAGDAAAPVLEILVGHGIDAEVIPVDEPVASLIARCAVLMSKDGRSISPPRPQYLRGPQTGARKPPIRSMS
jgi:tRNA threonylcarbamoyladenosine biosynthesis protein TsaB